MTIFRSNYSVQIPLGILERVRAPKFPVEVLFQAEVSLTDAMDISNTLTEKKVCINAIRTLECDDIDKWLNIAEWFKAIYIVLPAEEELIPIVRDVADMGRQISVFAGRYEDLGLQCPISVPYQLAPSAKEICAVYIPIEDAIKNSEFFVKGSDRRYVFTSK